MVYPSGSLECTCSPRPCSATCYDSGDVLWYQAAGHLEGTIPDPRTTRPRATTQHCRRLSSDTLRLTHTALRFTPALSIISCTSPACATCAVPYQPSTARKRTNGSTFVALCADMDALGASFSSPHFLHRVPCKRSPTGRRYKAGLADGRRFYVHYYDVPWRTGEKNMHSRRFINPVKPSSAFNETHPGRYHCCLLVHCKLHPHAFVALGRTFLISLAEWLASAFCSGRDRRPKRGSQTTGYCTGESPGGLGHISTICAVCTPLVEVRSSPPG